MSDSHITWFIENHVQESLRVKRFRLMKGIMFEDFLTFLFTSDCFEIIFQIRLKFFRRKSALVMNIPIPNNLSHIDFTFVL